MIKKVRVLSILILLLLMPVIPVFAQLGGLPMDNDNLTIRVSVMGPGDELYFWWGHIALIIDDRVSGESKLYDYGLFSFENTNFFVDFAFGRLLYSCGVSWAAPNIARYIYENRDVTFYTLDLPRETKERVREFAETNVRPENRNYWYHHFKDNCSTRIRDIIDLATGGQFAEAFEEAPGRFTLRQHVRRHTWFSPATDWLLNFLMGQDIDVPITVWQEMFLPSELGKRITNFKYRDVYGQERNLVRSVNVISEAIGRPAVLEAPRWQWPRELALSLIISLALGLLLSFRERSNRLKVLLGISQSLLGLFFGFSGLLVYFMSLFTNHDYTWHNMNLLFVSPLILAAVPLGLLYAFPADPFRRNLWAFLLKILWTLVFLGGILSIILHVLPQFWQQNQVTLALVLPFTAVLSLVPDWIAAYKREYLWRRFN
ncbi:conserved hypothetical protein [Treponema primitia ZAS-2]|uniref:Uncharacterized protein n=1 Tax=Treponema primitia (strain ATCC BAA-887 / DSM 12427 / ZAS-2) TaxID=545694 RepID=F5YN01_TREPZ|nr:DUF4105 domain-containing protein [Treponema primitia]AEF83556.1 conserved hypothetical protein [Treponema primitia ZAS-2]